MASDKSENFIDDEYLQTQHDYIYNADDDCNIEQWYPKIKNYTIPTYILPLTIEDIEALVTFAQYFRNCVDNLESDRYNIIDRNFSILDNYKHKWGEQCLWMKLNSFQEYKRKLKMIQYKLNTFMCQNEFVMLKKCKSIAFVPRLSIDMEMATDSLYLANRTYQCFENCLKNDNIDTNISILRLYNKCCWKAMEFENATNIIELIIRSEFMLNELNAAHCKLSESKDKINCSLLLQMIPYGNIENILEFRMFICSENPVGITQYQSFINYNHKNMESFILPISSLMIKEWNEILNEEKSDDDLPENIKKILIKQYVEIKEKLKLRKCKNYLIDFMIIKNDKNINNEEYKVYVVGINREPLYQYKYGLLDYFEDIQSKQVGLMFDNKIPKISVKLSIDSHIKNINNILPKYVLQYLYLNGWILPCNIQQLFSLIVWKFDILNNIISKTWQEIDKLIVICLKCWNFIRDEGGFGLEELFYISCGGLIVLWIQYVINNSLSITICTVFLQMILSDIIVPALLFLLGMWAVLGSFFTVLNLLLV